MTNYERLFGMPEKLAEVIIALNHCRVVGCEDCAANEVCMPKSDFWDVPTMVEWLEREEHLTHDQGRVLRSDVGA